MREPWVRRKLGVGAATVVDRVAKGKVHGVTSRDIRERLRPLERMVTGRHAGLGSPNLWGHRVERLLGAAEGKTARPVRVGTAVGVAEPPPQLAIAMAVSKTSATGSRRIAGAV